MNWVQRKRPLLPTRLQAASSPVGIRQLLVVDDQADVRWLVRLTLESAGEWHVTEATTAAEAIELAALFRPEVVVMDLGLPGGGLGLVDRFRALVPRPAIVVFSGREGTAMEAYAHGADAYVVKADASRALVDAVDDLRADSILTATLGLGPGDRPTDSAASWTEARCQTWGCPDIVATAMAVVDVLVTNVRAYANGPAELGLRLTRHNFRMQVSDAGSGTPDMKQYGRDHLDGLVSLDAWSDDWGIRSTADSRVVWSEIRRHVGHR